MGHKLTEIELDEVSLVDAGANPGAHIALFKSKGDKMNTEELKKALETAEAQTATLTKEKADLEAALAKAKEDAEAVKKTAEEAQTAELKKRDEEIEKLKGDLADAALTAEVEKKFPLTPGTTAEKVAKLKAVRAMTDETVKKSLEKDMETAEAGLAALAKEKGHSGAGDGEVKTAKEKLDALAKKLSEEQKITFEQGFSKAIDTAEGAKLYGEMRSKQEKGE